MTTDDARTLIDDVLREIAPGMDDPAGLAADADIRDALELDSLDFLNFVEALSKRTGRRIDEDDYPELATPGGTAAYLTGQEAGRG